MFGELRVSEGFEGAQGLGLRRVLPEMSGTVLGGF